MIEHFRRLFHTRAPRFLLLPFVVSACIDDPTGPNALGVMTVGASADSIWVGAPGEPIPTGVSIRIRNSNTGQPIAGAAITWEADGRNAVALGSGVSDAKGFATGVWQLGTDASELQQLRVFVRSGQQNTELVLRARAVPQVVSQLRVALDTPAVVRLGDTLTFGLIATDPHGNEFPPPDVTISVADSTVGSVAGVGTRGGPRRGETTVNLTSGGNTVSVPIRVIQHVAEIRPVADTILFWSLAAEVPVAYDVRDDRGRAVTDTVAAIAVEDTSIAQVSAGHVRSVAPGVTAVRLSIGSTSAAIAVGIQQRVASLRFDRDAIRFDALQDTTTVHAIAQDSLGSPIAHPQVALRTSNDSIVTASGATLRALSPGATTATIVDSATGIEASVSVVVEQRVASIDLAPVTFDALGDTIPVVAVPRDRLGYVVQDAALIYAVSDTAVAVVDGDRLYSRAEGVVTLTAQDPITETMTKANVEVAQVATGLTVMVTFGSPIITLPAGAPLPLSCLAVDRNGYPILRETALVGSVKGTVTGSGCADATIERSGYDTLRFAMGTAEARVPVIVASRPDSVAVLTAAWPLATDERIHFVGENLANPSILALRPLVADILADYGNPTGNLDRARAIRDWVARTAIYPDGWVRPDTTTSNLSVLPPGKTWFDVNRLLTLDRWNADVTYWRQFYADGYLILDRLLGTLDPATGRRAEDGMMEHVAGAHYRIRDVKTYHYVACSYQAAIVNTLWAAAGLHGTVASILRHDASAVFIPELGRWVYEDPTYNEEYLLDGVGEPLSPLDLLSVSTAGQGGRLQSVKMTGPSYDPAPYPPVRSYVDPANHPEGMIIMGAALYRRWVGDSGFSMRSVQVDVPALRSVPAPWSDPRQYVPVAAEVAYPTLAPVVLETRMQDSVAVIRLGSTYPNHHGFERRVPGGPWESVSDEDVLPVGACRVEYRSIDAVGGTSAVAVLDAWVPRSADFVTTAPAGSTRARASFCAPIQ